MSMVKVEKHNNIALVSINNPPVNALSRGVRDGLYEEIEKLGTTTDTEAIVLICDGRSFVAGADIKEFGKPLQGRSLQEVQNIFRQCPKPIIAAIHGTALGGGLELALCCHYRVAVPTAHLGLPEVHLGILPGAGGTQMLPRVVGAEKALDIMINGGMIKAKEALDMGLLDKVAEGTPQTIGLEFAQHAIGSRLPLKKVEELQDKKSADLKKTDLFENYRKKIARKTRGFLAPEAIIKCVEASLNMDFEEGLKFEQQEFLNLLSSNESAAQRYYFFSERQAKKIPGLDKKAPNIPVKKIGIIGAGTMGGGIAMNFANAGMPVTLVEREKEALKKGLDTIRKNYQRSADRGKITQEQVDTRCGLIEGTIDFERLHNCDLVIEAVFELMEIKKSVFKKIDAIVKPGAILATNTSFLDVNEIAAVTKRPESVIGLHFFSPANIMKLLEVVRGEKTSDDVINTCLALAAKIKKVGVLVGVCHGFVGNRILEARQSQAMNLIYQGCLPWDVDRVLFNFGMPMGPFAMNDLAGNDIGWDPEKSNGATIQERLCEQGRKGQKTGAGFYSYDPQTRQPSPDPIVANMIKEFNQDNGHKERKISDEEILDRCLLPMVNEGAKIMEEGIALRPSDIDVVWVNGYGWPVYKGGPMHWADSIGLDKVVSKLEKLSSEDQNENLKPAPLLLELAKKGKSFSDLSQ
ncbi:MAG: 3-hydroxyacyl-CoA dehydrogenase [Zetaproteobacteria bacterium]|nr:3-hydroxyacyl-CoA dehydrogenase [Pseudobdellovibrionaceae bacterium]